MPQTTLVPPDGITRPNDGTTSSGILVEGSKSSKFAVFTADWIEMQNFVAGALNLPISHSDFNTRYGAFDDKEAVANCVSAFQDLQTAGLEFGNPRTLLAERQSLMTGDRPASLYGQIIWTANRIANAAGSFHNTYAILKEVLDPAMSADERREALKDILTGPGGLRDVAVDMGKKSNDLSLQLMAFAQKVGLARDKVSLYAGESSKIFLNALTSYTDLQLEVIQLQLLINRLNKKYSEYVAAAAGGSVALMAFSAGLAFPLAIADAAVFGVLAEDTRKAKDQAQVLLKQEKAELTQKVTLQFDLGALNGQVKDICAKVESVARELESIAGVWANQVSVLDSIVEEIQIDTLLTFSALQDRLKILDAQAKWQQIASDTYEFTSTAFIQYQSSKSAVA